MGIFGNGNKSKKLSSRTISAEDAMKYVNDPNYSHYEFIPVEGGFQPQSKEEVREQIDRIKGRRLNPSFERTVITGGIYKGIDVKVSEANRSTQPRYNNYQNAKGYKKPTRGFERSKKIHRGI